QRSDCLVLPSEYDGWGAVVSEALLAGVPAICSDACGAAEAVRGSHRGGIFRSGDAADLAGLLRQQLQAGAPDRPERQTIAAWAEASLSGAAGGQYLTDILRSAFGQSPAPKAPWLT
ncbi:MAG: glycosyltransferase, partial [Pseudomonadota bacterium]